MTSCRVARLVKRILIILGVLLSVVLLYFAYAYRNLKLQSEAANRVRADREVTFQAELAQYRRVLRVGMPHSEVTKYLESRNVSYNEERGEITVNLGDEPDVFPCNRWAVYVSFEFARAQPEVALSPQDPLTAISLKRIGHCL
ncbi:MAG TPA: hypothetical protein VFF64_22745 [Candidatus Eremiobacteraceae bacterium]|nr:hypothetical protein [Candidatus Eremiobacteraceae bacterium]